LIEALFETLNVRGDILWSKLFLSWRTSLHCLANLWVIYRLVNYEHLPELSLTGKEVSLKIQLNRINLL